MIREQDGVALARYARASITAALGGPVPQAPEFPGADEPGATFVTLHRGDTLHGCIGTIEPRRPLLDDVRSNAVSAALYDPRATRLVKEDVAALSVEVSLLGPLERIACRSELEAIAALRPGEGVVLRSGLRRATYLPQVWENLPEPEVFLRSLKSKAGLSESYWSDDVELYRYSVTKFAA